MLECHAGFLCPGPQSVGRLSFAPSLLAFLLLLLLLLLTLHVTLLAFHVTLLSGR
jgi:hypothetical protein